jgi:FAD-linked sulfhydryl oxidase
MIHCEISNGHVSKASLLLLPLTLTVQRLPLPKMPRSPPPGFVLVSVIALFFCFIFYTRNMRHEHYGSIQESLKDSLHGSTPLADVPHLSPSTQHGDPIAPKLGNETLKAELGRAAWKLFHTTMARFPDKPSKDESDALKSYIYLFARLYPCGECAEHFQKIINKFPPQTSSRSTAAAWACHVHNEVNKAKGKELFDCGKIGDFYDCGCEDDEVGGYATGKALEKMVEKSGRGHGDSADEIEISVEGPINGG